jgi:uncharacterized protein YciI
MGGAFEDPADEALNIFRCEDKNIPEYFAKTDPYVLNGLITEWRVRHWSEVVQEKILATN